MKRRRDALGRFRRRTSPEVAEDVRRMHANAMLSWLPMKDRMVEERDFVLSNAVLDWDNQS